MHKNLRQEHGRTEIEVGPAFQAARQPAKEPKIVKARLAYGRAVRPGMNMNDVRAHSHVHGDRNIQAGRSEEHTLTHIVRSEERRVGERV